MIHIYTYCVLVPSHTASICWPHVEPSSSADMLWNRTAILINFVFVGPCIVNQI